MSTTTPTVKRFITEFGSEPRVYRAPGRVNLIGEHTDYNEGFVMPAAIGFYCWVAIGPRPGYKLVIRSQEFPGSAELDVDHNPTPVQPSRNWSDYPIGVALQLKQSGFAVAGANLFIHGEVPMGAGLSSSAAIEVATALALTDTSGNSVDRTQLARICQRAENQFVGTQSGIMDQFISLHGRRDHALMLDCRTLQFELLPLPESVRLVICDTGVKHEHAAGEYNRRRAECEEAVQRLTAALPNIRALRDVSPQQLEQHRGLLSEVVFKRALHVVTEDERVLKSADALRTGDLHRFGKYMAESHNSLRDLYEVSCRELDLMVEIANQQEGLYGARMTGGGFGGSTINLVKDNHAETFAKNVGAAYREATGISPQTYICMPADGAARVDNQALAG
jgi:galactokinase